MGGGASGGSPTRELLLTRGRQPRRSNWLQARQRPCGEGWRRLDARQGKEHSDRNGLVNLPPPQRAYMSRRPRGSAASLLRELTYTMVQQHVMLSSSPRGRQARGNGCCRDPSEGDSRFRRGQPPESNQTAACRTLRYIAPNEPSTWT